MIMNETGWEEHGGGGDDHGDATYYLLVVLQLVVACGGCEVQQVLLGVLHRAF